MSHVTAAYINIQVFSLLFFKRVSVKTVRCVLLCNEDGLPGKTSHSTICFSTMSTGLEAEISKADVTNLVEPNRSSRNSQQSETDL